MEDRYKHPRTFHLDYSESLQSDDKMIDSLDAFEGEEVVITIKMDGENTSMYPDGYSHARSIDSKTNWTRDIVKKILSVIQYDIPEGYRLGCENLYAKHSIYYPEGYLDGYVYLLCIWDEKNNLLSWDEIKLYAELFDLPTCKEIYRGIYDPKKIKELVKTLDTDLEEGFVMRLTKPIHFDDYSKSVAKFVRAGHVQENEEHWLKNATPNGLPKQPCKPAFLSANTNRNKM